MAQRLCEFKLCRPSLLQLLNNLSSGGQLPNRCNQYVIISLYFLISRTLYLTHLFLLYRPNPLCNDLTTQAPISRECATLRSHQHRLPEVQGIHPSRPLTATRLNPMAIHREQGPRHLSPQLEGSHIPNRSNRVPHQRNNTLSSIRGVLCHSIHNSNSSFLPDLRALRRPLGVRTTPELNRPSEVSKQLE